MAYLRVQLGDIRVQKCTTAQFSLLSLNLPRLVGLGGIFQGIGGRRPRGPHLGQMARVVPVYPLIVLRRMPTCPLYQRAYQYPTNHYDRHSIQQQFQPCQILIFKQDKIGVPSMSVNPRPTASKYQVSRVYFSHCNTVLLFIN